MAKAGNERRLHVGRHLRLVAQTRFSEKGGARKSAARGRKGNGKRSRGGGGSRGPAGDGEVQWILPFQEKEERDRGES